MRRECFPSDQSYINWLKSLGCVLYLPLHGDMQDKISGEYIQLTGNGRIDWDDNECMYRFKAPSYTGQYVGFIQTNVSRSTFPSNRLTVLHGIKRINQSDYLRTISPNTTNQKTLLALCAHYNASGRLAGFPDEYIPVGHVFNDQVGRAYYQGGVLYNTYGPYTGYLPSRWQTSGNGIKLCNYSDTVSGAEWYMDEVYLFNTALDISTIRKIQRYE